MNSLLLFFFHNFSQWIEKISAIVGIIIIPYSLLVEFLLYGSIHHFFLIFLWLRLRSFAALLLSLLYTSFSMPWSFQWHIRRWRLVEKNAKLEIIASSWVLWFILEDMVEENGLVAVVLVKLWISILRVLFPVDVWIFFINFLILLLVL